MPITQTREMILEEGEEEEEEEEETKIMFKSKRISCSISHRSAFK